MGDPFDNFYTGAGSKMYLIDNLILERYRDSIRCKLSMR